MEQQETGRFLGNEKIISQLSQQARNARLAALPLALSYIFAGPGFSGKKEASLWFAQALLCPASRDGRPCTVCQHCRQVTSGAHPDLLWLKRVEEKKEISIEAVRDLISRLSRGSFVGGQQVAVIEGADNLNDEGANCLLKTLEEPVGGTVIILLVEEPDKMLRTIMSRSQQFFFRPASQAVLAKELETSSGLKRREAQEIARMALGRPRLAWILAADQELYKKRLSAAAALVDGYGAGAGRQLSAVANLLGTATGQEAARQSKEILDIWQLVARDWLLATAGAEELMIYQSLSDKLAAKGRNVPAIQVLALCRLIGQGYSQLAANVNPKLVLENILLNANVYA